MQYDKKRAKGFLYPNTITKKIEFDEDETLNVILLNLIDVFKDQVDLIYLLFYYLIFYR